MLAARAAAYKCPTTRTRWPAGAGIAQEMAARGDHAGAEAEFRDVLAARLRVLGPDHPSTQITSHFMDDLA